MFDYEAHIDHPSAWLGHREFARELVMWKKPATIVELGTHWGHSFFSMVQGVKDAGLNTRCIAIDHWRGDQFTGAYDPDTVYETVKKVAGEVYPDQDIELWRMTFDEGAKKMGQRKADILHIDGAHDYESVRHDWDTWRTKLKKGAIVLMHDIEVGNFGVRRVWAEIRAENPEWFFEEREGSYGLGVIHTSGQEPIRE